MVLSLIQKVLQEQSNMVLPSPILLFKLRFKKMPLLYFRKIKLILEPTLDYSVHYSVTYTVQYNVHYTVHYTENNNAL